jgi:ATP-binding cassette subfamily B protein
VPPLGTGIRFEGVWFRYHDDQPWVLRDFDLHLPHGTAVALVGLNGAGKSTVVKLLCRLYEPTAGRITWDGVDVRTFDVAALRARIATVLQDCVRYELTARDSIGLGDLRAGDAEVRAAAARAGVGELIDGLPAGFDTMLSRTFAEDPTAPPGVELSGGQWQRLAVARALLRERADLLILDEPVSGLDARAEHDLHRTLRGLRAARTTLLVSHRLGSARDADQIVVLADGRIVERGDHDALLRADGRYAELFRLQADGYHDAAAGVREPA